MTRNDLLHTLRQEIQKVTGYEAPLEEQQLLSQILNSMGFLRLLLTVEDRLGIVIDDEDFYTAAPLTVGDLAAFLYESCREVAAAAAFA